MGDLVDNELVLPIIGGLFTILGGGGFWTYWQSRKDTPIRKRDADIAAADASVQMALSVATAAREHGNTLQGELDSTRERLSVLTGEVKGLQTHVREQDRTIRGLRSVVQVFSDAWDALVLDWDTLRLRTTPPVKPQPHTEGWLDLMREGSNDSL